MQTEDIQVENALFFPSINMKYANEKQKKDQINLIKQAIMDYGAIAFASMAPAYGMSAYNNENYAIYTEEQWEVNAASHMMLIVGWDDTFENTNFNAGVTTGEIPKMNGAWIVQNSWGTDNGIDGYYYYSYEDYGLNTNDLFAVSKVSTIDYDNIYQYNPNGEIRTAEGNKFANVFTKETNKEFLNEISFFNFYPNTEYKIYVNNIDGELTGENVKYITTYNQHHM